MFGVLAVAQADAGNGQPIRITLAHDAPASVLWEDFFNRVAERQELLAEPVRKLMPVQY
jgi:hypothetical protein